MRNENEFKCPKCGYGVYSERTEGVFCAKCETQMIYLGKRNKNGKKDKETFKRY